MTDGLWIAIQVRYRYEQNAAKILRVKGYDEFVPVCRTVRQWSDRQRVGERPLFPGYVFCKFRADSQTPIITTVGVIRIVGTRAGPTPIQQSEIDAIRRIADAGCDAQPHPYLAVGSRVRVQEGPLAGIEGILSDQRNQRLIVSVDAVQRSISIEIGRSGIAVLEAVS